MLCQFSPHSRATLLLSPMWSVVGTFQFERSHHASIIRHQHKIIASDWSAGDDVALSTTNASRRHDMLVPAPAPAPAPAETPAPGRPADATSAASTSQARTFPQIEL